MNVNYSIVILSKIVPDKMQTPQRISGESKNLIHFPLKGHFSVYNWSFNHFVSHSFTVTGATTEMPKISELLATNFCT